MISKHKEDWKKAMLQLKAGQHIDAFEVTQQEAPVEEKKKVEEKKTITKK
jgi:hypothetical protein